MAGVPRPRCALMSRLFDEPLPATAPAKGGSWLAVEHPGPWPPGWDERLPPSARAVLTKAAAMGVRPQLIRRPGRRRLGVGRHTVLVCSHRGIRPWLERAVIDDLSRLATLDLAAVAAGRPPGFGVLTTTPALLVCTHGRRDVCCAQYGRPVAAAMAAAWPGQVWETTHLAGDRFAANVVCLPYGTYHGRVSPQTAGDVAAACMAGQVHLAHYRGRAGLPAPVQAAEHALRVLTGCNRVDAVVVERFEPDDRGGALVVLSAGRRRFAVPVRRTDGGPPRPTSCAACLPDVPVSYLAGAPQPLYAAPAGAVFDPR